MLSWIISTNYHQTYFYNMVDIQIDYVFHGLWYNFANSPYFIMTYFGTKSVKLCMQIKLAILIMKKFIQNYHEIWGSTLFHDLFFKIYHVLSWYILKNKILWMNLQIETRTKNCYHFPQYLKSKIPNLQLPNPNPQPWTIN